MKRRCSSCGLDYSVAVNASYDVFICQDCSERALAKIQHRAPRFIYDENGMATVIVDAGDHTGQPLHRRMQR